MIYISQPSNLNCHQSGDAIDVIVGDGTVALVDGQFGAAELMRATHGHFRQPWRVLERPGEEPSDGRQSNGR
jgi:hypothetical protein